MSSDDIDMTTTEKCEHFAYEIFDVIFSNESKKNIRKEHK